MTGSLVEWPTITSRAGRNPVGLDAELGFDHIRHMDSLD
jgi:hypothetical protein